MIVLILGLSGLASFYLVSNSEGLDLEDNVSDTAAGFQDADLRVEEGYARDEGLYLVLHNYGSEDLTVTRVTVGGHTQEFNRTVPVASTRALTVPGFEEASETRSYDVSIVYNGAVLSNLESRGTVRGEFKQVKP